jgi:hypothetical protein
MNTNNTKRTLTVKPKKKKTLLLYDMPVKRFLAKEDWEKEHIEWAYLTEGGTYTHEEVGVHKFFYSGAVIEDIIEDFFADIEQKGSQVARMAMSNQHEATTGDCVYVEDLWGTHWIRLRADRSVIDVEPKKFIIKVKKQKKKLVIKEDKPPPYSWLTQE